MGIKRAIIIPCPCTGKRIYNCDKLICSVNKKSCDQYKKKTSVILKSLIGSSILVIFDYVLEPVAIKYDYWTWHHANVPLQNYVGWFVVSFLLLLLFNFLNFTKNNKLAQTLFIIQFVFFILLALF